MENNQADPANPILNTKGPCFVTLNEGLKRVDSLFNKRAVQDLLNKCPKFPPWNLIFLRGCCVLEGISAPQVHPSGVVPSFCFLDGNFRATLCCFSSLKKRALF